MAASGVGAEGMLWRLLRIGSAPYFVLGNDRRTGAPARYRIASPWDWRALFELEEFTVTPSAAGQPRVDWACTYRSREDDSTSERGRPRRDPLEPRSIRPAARGQGLSRHADVGAPRLPPVDPR